MLLRELFYRLLNENLTKGSNNVLSNKKLVANIADNLRDDADFHPTQFGGQAANIKRMSDEDATKWFLTQLDRMEQEGYNGVVSTRNGVNNLWIAQRYSENKDTWEDITGKLQPVIFDYYLLKNSGNLDANHVDIMKFSGVKQLGAYLVTHYADILAKLREKVKNKRRAADVKSIKIVDNKDYVIILIFNRVAAQKYGLGTRWCTAMEHNATHYHNYSKQAILINIFPKNATDITVNSAGRETVGPEKYQCDAGATRPNFHDIGDGAVTPSFVRQRFPYLYNDLRTAMEEHSAKIQEYIDEWNSNPTLSSNNDTAVKPYNIQLEIAKLHYFVVHGYMDPDNVRSEEPEEPEDQA